MTNMQRMRNDVATTDKRDTADRTMKDSRVRNDNLTRERRYIADETMDKNRIRNDEITSDRRETKDRSINAVLIPSLLILVAFTVGTLSILI